MAIPAGASFIFDAQDLVGAIADGGAVTSWTDAISGYVAEESASGAILEHSHADLGGPAVTWPLDGSGNGLLLPSSVSISSADATFVVVSHLPESTTATTHLILFDTASGRYFFGSYQNVIGFPVAFRASYITMAGSYLGSRMSRIYASPTGTELWSSLERACTRAASGCSWPGSVSGTTRIGSIAGGAWAWPGSIAWMGFWPRALTDAEYESLIVDTLQPIWPGAAVGVAGAFGGGVVDSIPPAVAEVSAPSTSAPTDPWVVDVTDETSLAHVSIFAIDASEAGEAVYDGSNFLGRFAGVSSRVDITDGGRYSVQPFDSWYGDMILRVVTVDGGGNVVTQDYEATGATPPTDAAPVASILIAPTKPSDPIVAEVTDDAELALVVLFAEFPDESYDVIWDGSKFAGRYSSSERVAITGGHRYTLRRAGGWGEHPTLRAEAVDSGGNRA